MNFLLGNKFNPFTLQAAYLGEETFCAPELLLDTRYTEKVDIYRFLFAFNVL
jgi:hypothetical protein